MSLIEKITTKQPTLKRKPHKTLKTKRPKFKIELSEIKRLPEKTVAVAGNPNVGKSTVLNALTGLRQHTGNWPGKTVECCQGTYFFKEQKFNLVDLPGTYSLSINSPEEKIAKDFILSSDVDTVLVILDATCLERNLNLALQILEITQKVVICVNLMDEAKSKNIFIDLDELSLQLGVPVVGTNARKKENFCLLMELIQDVSNGNRKIFHKENEYGETLKKIINEEKIEESIENVMHKIFKHSSEICKQCVKIKSKNPNKRDRKIDKYLTSKSTGIPIMLLLLVFIFWLTLVGANYPSQLLASGFLWLQDKLILFCEFIHMPVLVSEILVDGVYKTLSWVISVMLPPMAIFFPLFTFLEDIGYLPRVAFNLDSVFKKAGAHGKQALTTCMGFGCNACGIMGCRIIDSPRERLIAIITNNFTPCNGRFPMMISIISLFFISGSLMSITSSIISALILTGLIVLGLLCTFMISKILSKTILKGIASSFALELPPYRNPQIGKVLVRSILDRTIFVLGRAIAVAAPAGLIIWFMANVYLGNTNILSYCSNFLDPFARFIGLDGIILMAFILGFPANEIVMPIIIMSYMCQSSMLELESSAALYNLIVANGWTIVTAICTVLFSLMHFPCGTAMLTIKKETGSFKWTVLSFIIPTATGIIVCGLVANLCRSFGIN